jgi:uncharacterized protein with PQ loop repeat
VSIFEIGMLACFGASWPFNVMKTYRTKSARGKSFMFLWLIFIGYVSGTLHKIYFNYDHVIWLYVFNGVMVAIDLSLAYTYLFRERKDEPLAEAAGK